jgi:alpha-1,2-mannosyltransferase
MRRWWLVLVAVLTVAVVWYAVSVPGALTDLKVYRAGGASWLRGVPLYTPDFPFWLPFTYPPSAAVLFGVLAVLPFAAAAALLTAASLVALSASTYWAVPLPVVPVVAVAAAFLLEPVRTTLQFGQVNLLLMAMVAADCLLPRTRYPRGLLIGVAAAVKLTPAVFVLFFLARRQVQPAVTAVVTFAAATGAGMLFAPADSLRDWYTTIFDPDRIGGADFATNQSLRAALTRLDLPATQVVWLVGSVVVLGLVWRGARRAPDPLVALLVVAAGGLVVSPVSWSHHFVWIAPALAYLAYRARWVPLVALTGVFAVGHRFLPHARHRELSWTWWQHLAGDSYLLIALAFLVWAAVGVHEVPHPGGTRATVSVGGRG